MMEYESPVIEITYFKSRDVVRASLVDGTGTDKDDKIHQENF